MQKYEFEYPEFSTLTSNTKRDIYIKIHYPEFYKYLCDNYSHLPVFNERLYWFYNNITTQPVCKMCGGPVRYYNSKYGYNDYCRKCCNKVQSKKDKIRDTMLAKYGATTPFKSTKIRNKIKQTCIDKYGVDNVFKSASIRKRVKATLIERYGGVGFGSEELKCKQHEKMLELYGATNPMSVTSIQEKMKQNSLEKYGVEYPLLSRQAIEKSIKTCVERYSDGDMTGIDISSLNSFYELPFMKEHVIETKRKNHTFNTSKIEEEFSKYLTSKGLEHIRQYKSDVYPFACDFYIPKHDLYVEIQGSWTHGKHPFDVSDASDVALAEAWRSSESKYYRNAARVWCEADVHKRSVAKACGLNYLELFTNKIDDAVKAFENHLPV